MEQLSIASLKGSNDSESQFIAALHEMQTVLYDWGQDCIECLGHKMSADRFLQIAGISNLSAEKLIDLLKNSGKKVVLKDS